MVELTVIIPTYNESGVILETIEHMQSELSEISVEILVVDDDSPDGTWELVRSEHSNKENVRVIRRCSERGLGTAVLRGIDEANSDYCVVADADLQHPPRFIKHLYRRLQNEADLVIGSRYVPGGDIKGWSRSRLVISLGAVAIARALIPEARSVRDPISGFFGLETSVVDTTSFSPNGYKILLEILVRGEYTNLVEEPFTFEDRKAGESKFNISQYQKFLQLVLTLSGFEVNLQSFRDLVSGRVMPEGNQQSSEEHG